MNLRRSARSWTAVIPPRRDESPLWLWQRSRLRNATPTLPTRTKAATPRTPSPQSKTPARTEVHGPIARPRLEDEPEAEPPCSDRRLHRVARSLQAEGRCRAGGPGTQLTHDPAPEGGFVPQQPDSRHSQQLKLPATITAPPLAHSGRARPAMRTSVWVRKRISWPPAMRPKTVPPTRRPRVCELIRSISVSRFLSETGKWDDYTRAAASSSARRVFTFARWARYSAEAWMSPSGSMPLAALAAAAVIVSAVSAWPSSFFSTARAR